MPIFSLTLDDQSPHPDAGECFDSVGWCDKLIDKYPDFKVTLFVPAAYARLNSRPYHLTKHPEWVRRMNDLPRENYCVGLHGLFHRRLSADFTFHTARDPSNNDEFQFLNEYMANIVIGKMLEEFDSSGLQYSKVFRPPGWKISVSSAKVLTSRGILISGNEQYYDILKDKVPDMRWVGANWHLEEDAVPEGDIVAAGHTSNWVWNYLDKKRYDIICGVLEKQEYDFKFLQEML